MATRPEFPAAMYRLWAAIAQDVDNAKAEKHHLQQALLAYENPLPPPHQRRASQCRKDAFGNLRWDHNTKGMRYPEHTGVYNPKDRTRAGLSRKKV
jgi:hypothetical protein